MQFLVYLTVLMVSVSTVLLEIHWLTTPAPQPKSAMQASAPPRPKVEGPSAALSPVYPKKLEPVQPVQPAPTAQNNVQNTVEAATASNTAAKTETAQKPVAETTGAATRSDDRSKTQSAVPPDNAQNAQAYAAQPKQTESERTAASNNQCDVQTCASAYKSFRASDCSYQPFGGTRRICGKAPEQRADREQSADREQRNEPQRRSWSRREDSEDTRDTDRRTRWRVYDEDDDDGDDVILFRRSRRW